MKTGNNILKIRDIAITIGFLLFLVFPTVQKYFPIVPEMENTENRKLSDEPVLDLGFLDPFPQEYENYYNDHFSLRNQLVNLKSSLIVSVTEKSPMPDKVIIGKEGWLYLVYRELAEYRGTNHLKPDTIDILVKEMIRRKEYLKSKNIKLYLAVVPTKYTVYPEYLPNYVDVISKTSRTDEVIAVLRKNNIGVLDLRPLEIKAKGEIPLYYKTDNHWNNYGAFYAYGAIVRWIKKDFPGLPVLSFDDFVIDHEIKKGFNTAKMLNMEDQFKDIWYNFIPKTTLNATRVEKVGYPVPEGFPYPKEFEMNYETGNDSLPNILVICDSFTNALKPFLSNSFNRSVFIFDSWNYTSNEHIIQKEHPDIVLYIVLESLWNGFLTGVEKSPTFDLSPKSEPHN